MPNLRAIIDGDVLNLAPDLYLRDFVGDVGDPHTGAISASPDVILRQTTELDPQASFIRVARPGNSQNADQVDENQSYHWFGEGSGTENSPTLGFEAEAGQDNFVYLRVRNRGSSVAANVEATVYWAPVATLVTPDLWTLVGSTTLPSVPTGDLLTVSDAIVWPSGAIPTTGHYCFVALIGHAHDPTPAPADFLSWDNFRLFIRANNNVTWRNFNVVNNTPPPSGEPPNYVPLPFLAAGAPDRARRMRLEVVGRLPKGSAAVLEISLDWTQLLQVQPIQVKGAKQRRVVYAPVNPCGRTSFPEVVFPARSRIPMRLLVNVPREMRKHQFEIFARQWFENEEVGRVTWRLVPARKSN
jgi:serine protease